MPPHYDIKARARAPLRVSHIDMRVDISVRREQAPGQSRNSFPQYTHSFSRLNFDDGIDRVNLFCSKLPCSPLPSISRILPPIRSSMLNHSWVWVDCSDPCANLTATNESKIISRITQTLVLSCEFPRLCGLTMITLFLSFAVNTFWQACVIPSLTRDS